LIVFIEVFKNEERNWSSMEENIPQFLFTQYFTSNQTKKTIRQAGYLVLMGKKQRPKEV
jgi:hypothetical protein